MEAPNTTRGPEQRHAEVEDEGDVELARLVCSTMEIYPVATAPPLEWSGGADSGSADVRFSSTEFRLCLLADGRLRTVDSPAARVDWHLYDVRRNRGAATSDAPLRSDAGWHGVCTTDGHVTLEIDGHRLLAGHLLPPCSVAGSVTSSTSQGGLFEVNMSYVELTGGGGARRAGTWDELLALLRQLRAYERLRHGAVAAAAGTSVGAERVDFSAYLPLEAIYGVCSFLSVSDVLSLGACSQVLHHICAEPWLWKQIYERRFGTHTLLVPLRAAYATTDADGAEHQHGIEELKEGFGTPVAEAQVMWSGQAWPIHPPYLADPDDDGKEEDDWLGRYKQAISKDSLEQSDLVINEGLFVLDGHTKNSASSGNVTRVQGVRMKLQRGLLWAEMQYSTGSAYNRETGAVWVGRYDRRSRRIEWRERYATHNGLFHYTGRVVDHHTVTGTYRWDANGATGTFEYHLASPIGRG